MRDDGTIGELLLSWADKTPDSRYVQCASRWLTYADVAARSERVAVALHRLGVAKGDRVAFLLPNQIEFVILIFAGARLGVIQVPLNTYLRGEFLRYQLANSQASVIVTDALGVEQVRAIASELPDLRQLITVGELDDVEAGRLGMHVTTYGELEADTSTAEMPDVRSEDVCAIMYTSGTSGMPKGCLIPHSYWLAIAGAFAPRGWVQPGDTLLTAWPLFHTGGHIYGLGIPLTVGAAVAIEPLFHASTSLDRVRETEATLYYGMNAMAYAILAQPPRDNDRDHKLRLAFFLPHSADTTRGFLERFGVPVISELYGQTECVPVTISSADGPRREGSAGQVNPDYEVALVDDGDNRVPVGEIGEIVVRPNRPGVLYQGYWNNPEATVAASRNLWHHTGDFGRMDEDGFLHFVDRKKDALRRRGEFVTSLELEQAIIKHPLIAAVAVHAVPSELSEDDIKACIVPQADAELTAKALFEFFRDALPYYAIPRYVELFDELPTNAASRVQKHKLRERGVTDTTWDFENLGLVVLRDDRRKV